MVLFFIGTYPANGDADLPADAVKWSPMRCEKRQMTLKNQICTMSTKALGIAILEPDI